MKHLVFTLAFGAAIVATAAAQSESASGFITYTQNGSNWNYDIHLTDTGSTTIGTLWFSWVPGEGFLPSQPTPTGGPTGWNGGVVTDHYSIQWIASTVLQPGQTIDGFTFTSPDSPTVLEGTNNGFPIGTSFVYQAGPFSDSGFQFVINPVPEPMTFLGLGLGAFALIRRRRTTTR